ncbi:MAG: hypothetical protein OXL33_00180, partial [Chloroflexota bacterium]|nr:hypothetical protein [Chloroflexota bacterium]
MDRKAEDRYRKKHHLISIKDEEKARRRLHKRRKKGYSAGLLIMTGGLEARPKSPIRASCYKRIR